MARWPARIALGALALLAACQSANSVPTQLTYKPIYAQVRLLSLVATPDAGDTEPGDGGQDAGIGPDGGLSAFVVVPNDLDTIWDLGVEPVATPFQQTVVTQCPTDGGTCDDMWTLDVSRAETSVASDAIKEPDAGSFCTFILAPLGGAADGGTLTDGGAAPDGGTLAVKQGLTELPSTPPEASTASVELVFGVPDLEDASVTIGSMAVPGPFPPAQELATPLILSPGSTTITITPTSGQPIVFDDVPLTAGALTTLALAQSGNGSLELLVVTDSFSSSTINESMQTLSPSGT